MREAISFDDVLLIPRKSEMVSRKNASLSVDLGKGVVLDLPIISSPMDTISETDMANAMTETGGIAIVHRYNTIEEQALIVKRVVSEKYPTNVGAAIGISGDYLERATTLYSAGVNILCVDVAHGHHKLMRDALYTLKNKFNDSVHLMAGNVATLDGFNDLADWGADSIRVGIGGGSICSTRLQTGHGMPTFQSILDCSKSDRDVALIADGGIKNNGDIVKALAAGADAVMVGSLLAGTEETPGSVFVGKNGKKYKVYRGMASKDAQIDWKGDFSAPEGISTTVPYKGSIKNILANIRGNLQSGLSYSGANNIIELRQKCEFIRQTFAGQSESATHILGVK